MYILYTHVDGLIGKLTPSPQTYVDLLTWLVNVYKTVILTLRVWVLVRVQKIVYGANLINIIL